MKPQKRVKQEEGGNTSNKVYWHSLLSTTLMWSLESQGRKHPGTERLAFSSARETRLPWGRRKAYNLQAACSSESRLHLLISEHLCAGSSAEGARQQLTIYFFLLTVFLLGSGISMQLPCQHHFRPFLLPSPSPIPILVSNLFLGPFWPTAQILSLSPLTLEKRLKHPRRLTMQ